MLRFRPNASRLTQLPQRTIAGDGRPQRLLRPKMVHAAWSCLLVLTIVLGAASTATAVTPFYTQTVDAVSDVGTYASLSLDMLGRPHLSYFEGIAADLKYAVKIDGVWGIETVDASGNVGLFTSLALDATGNPHISYYDNANSDLKYAAKIDGAWTIETVDATGSVGQYTSLALDASGDPHVSYYDIGSSDLKYAVKTGGAWTLETVDAAGFVGWYTSLALDAAGNPHISYYDNTNIDVKYAVKFGGVWAIETVDATGSVGQHTSLALDAAGNPHISYLDFSNNDLKYATKTGGMWITEMVDATGIVGQYTSLALDALGAPHISYYDVANTNLKYAVSSEGVWSTETIDATGSVGRYTSLNLDAQGSPHIGYYDTTNGDLKYASAAITLTSPVGGECWTPGGQETVTWQGLGVIDIEISFDGGGSYQTLKPAVSGGVAVVDAPTTVTDGARVRIVRADPYAASSSPGLFAIGPALVLPWWSETVQSTGDVGSYTSLAVNTQGIPYVSYRDDTNGDLRFDVRSSGGWVTEIADSAGDVGWYTSMRLDAAGDPHICHYDATDADLLYTRRVADVWTTEIASGDEGFYPSLDLDSGEAPHVSYYDVATTSLKYAVKSGTWSDELIDADGGPYSSLAIDSWDVPHVAYYEGFPSDLRYAVREGGVWVSEKVDSVGFVGSFPSLALESDGTPHICYDDASNTALKYATKLGGIWNVTTVDDGGDVGRPSLILDDQGTPHVTYRDNITEALKYATIFKGKWVVSTVDAEGDVGLSSSLAQDANGNFHVSYYETTPAANLRYASTAITMNSPGPGEVWPVGADRTVTWTGAGTIDISLSVDGGSTYMPVAENVTGGSHGIVVPHTPSLFCRIRIERKLEDNTFLTYYYPPAVTETNSFFTIETEISLLSFLVTVAPQSNGHLLSWNTNPGPTDLLGYRLERRRRDAEWITLVDGTTETTYRDTDGQAGDRYRLYASNGLGEEFYLGDSSDGRVPQLDGRLTAWPVPFRSGDLQIRFGTVMDGGVPQATEVAIYDVAGRRVRTVAEVKDPSSHIVSLTWDGRDDTGRRVASGIYFLRIRSGQTQHTRKLVIVR